MIATYSASQEVAFIVVKIDILISLCTSRSHCSSFSCLYIIFELRTVSE